MTNDETTEFADRFADLACLTYGGDHVSRRQQAEEMLAASPDIGAATPCAAATAFDVAAIRAYLQADAGYAARVGGAARLAPADVCLLQPHHRKPTP